MLSNSFRKNKKAQTSETVTWIVATVVLIIILLIFIYASIALSKTKQIKTEYEESSGENDWVNSKTELAFSKDNQNKQKIENWISEENKNEE